MLPPNPAKRRTKLLNYKIGRLLLAGVWFGIAAVIPVAYYLLRFGDAGLPIFGGSVALTAAAPIALAIVCGALFGSAILEPAETKTPFAAALRGLLVSLLSFLLLFTIPAIITLVTSPDFLGTALGFGVFFLYGLFIVGWLVAAVGAIAGWLLYVVGLRS